MSWTTNAIPLWPLVEKGLALLLALAVLYLAPPLDLPRAQRGPTAMK